MPSFFSTSCSRVCVSSLIPSWISCSSLFQSVSTMVLTKLVAFWATLPRTDDPNPHRENPPPLQDETCEATVKLYRCIPTTLWHIYTCHPITSTQSKEHIPSLTLLFRYHAGQLALASPAVVHRTELALDARSLSGPTTRIEERDSTEPSTNKCLLRRVRSGHEHAPACCSAAMPQDRFLRARRDQIIVSTQQKKTSRCYQRNRFTSK